MVWLIAKASQQYGGSVAAIHFKCDTCGSVAKLSIHNNGSLKLTRRPLHWRGRRKAPCFGPTEEDGLHSVPLDQLVQRYRDIFLSECNTLGK